MKLLIVRHGKAYDPNPMRWPDDSQRPLTDEGRARFTKSVPTIKALAPKEIRVISSLTLERCRPPKSCATKPAGNLLKSTSDCLPTTGPKKRWICSNR